MPFISITRLRVRALRFLPAFAWHTIPSLRQVREALGFQGGALLPDRDWAFWTMTAWDSEASMRHYIMAGSHRTAMPHLLNWCDEASVVHWVRPDDGLPSWAEADRRMRENGRASRVRFPSANHAALTYRAPRLTRATPIRAATAARR